MTMTAARFNLCRRRPRHSRRPKTFMIRFVYSYSPDVKVTTDKKKTRRTSTTRLANAAKKNNVDVKLGSDGSITVSPIVNVDMPLNEWDEALRKRQ
jgi:hypothetical protein